MHRSGSDTSKALADLAAVIGRAGKIMDSVAMAAAVRISQLPPAEAKRMLQAILDGPTSVVLSKTDITLEVGRQHRPFVTVKRSESSVPKPPDSKRAKPSWFLGSEAEWRDRVAAR